jgi:hypothetical protein
LCMDAKDAEPVYSNRNRAALFDDPILRRVLGIDAAVAWRKR